MIKWSNLYFSLNVEAEIQTFNVIYLLKAAEPDKFALLLPYMGSFIKFLGGLSDEASPKVIALGLERILSCSQFFQEKLILNFTNFPICKNNPIMVKTFAKIRISFL